MKDKLNIVIVGGGSTWCPGILKALTKHMDILPLNRVMLYDIDAERQRPIGEFGKILFAEEEPGVEFGYTTDKDEAYTDVDFVLCQIRTGGYEMRSKDEKIPLHMGIIGQETVGPGGMAYGMRSMHDMVEIVNDVRAHPLRVPRSHGWSCLCADLYPAVQRGRLRILWRPRSCR